MRPTIDSLMPRRSPATAPGRSPAACRGRTPVELGVVGLDEHVDTVDAGVTGGVDDAPRGPRRRARARRRRAAGRRRRRPRPRTSWSVLDADGEGVDGGVQRRRLALVRSCRRATPAARAPGGGRASSSAAGRSVRCISTSDCSTESWRWAATRGPLVVADARRPLVVEAAQQAAERRGGEDRQTADDDGDGAGRGADPGQPTGAVGQRGHARRRAGRCRRRPAPHAPATPPTAGGATAERPDDRDADGDRRGRHHDPVARPQPDRPGRATSTAAVAQPMASSRRQRSADDSGDATGAGTLSVERMAAPP